MTHPTASLNYSERQAGSLRTGDLLLLPDAERTAEIVRVDVDNDDFGSPAIVRATLTGGGVLRIAAGSVVLVLDPVPDSPEASPADGAIPAADAAGPGADSPADSGDDSADGGAPGLQLVEHLPDGDGAPAAPGVVVPPRPVAPPVASGPSEADLALIPAADGTPESVVEAAAEAHPDALGVLLLSDRLTKGINTKSGSCLKDLSDLAHELFVVLKDAENALAVADLLNVLPFDGNPGRWASVEASLALASYICRQRGEEERAEVYEKFLRAPDEMETDPFKARINAKVRQRSLNEPNLYDKEIFRAIDNSNPDAEREWRLLRLEALLFLRAHGGSQTIGAPELERRIGNELESVRG
ncbi:hypothetical protein E7Y32_03250 [Arthrobacter sp. UKPF54-2]|uniref:DUF6707 family protein n=1 Tax=Arthrobacter sp. UKPF54-2 TaxID=2600159 RepID=UPI0011B18765|nr:DUF6707 family protein [Arthrobacter sp. UKPF54-2]QDY89333.1 hypothetical protein E7Y32_03250 [Arthrobacter sp. UKPF54-2]